MAYMVKWGPKGFLVSPSKVVPFDGFSTDMKLKADSENDTSGTEPTNTRGRELRTISLRPDTMPRWALIPERRLRNGKA